MYYYCIENQQVISALPYSPTVPPSVTVVQVSDQDHERITRGELVMDAQRCQVGPVPQSLRDQMAVQEKNQQLQSFLEQTDWKVLRHMRELALAMPTTLTHEQYIDLERQRHQAATGITRS